jgi:hypothetical protein
MALTPEEKVKIRYHLGYLEVTDAASLTLGIPASRQLLFVIEDAMNRVMPGAEWLVRDLLKQLDCTEQKLKDVACSLKVEKVGNVVMRGAKEGETYPDLLEREVLRWANRLADVLGVPPYAYSRRFNGQLTAGSIPVR